jgi:hypothetical protein
VNVMMGERRVGQDALFYEFSLERHVPAEHMLRSIDRFVDLSGARAHLGRAEQDPRLAGQIAAAIAYEDDRDQRERCEGSLIAFFASAWPQFDPAPSRSIGTMS